MDQHLHDGTHSQPAHQKGDGDATSLRPDFRAFEELCERKPSLVSSLVFIAATWSFPRIAFVGMLLALTIIAREIIKAGDTLTHLGLIGALVVASMILGMTVFLVSREKHATNCQERADAAAEPGDEPAGPRATGAAPGRDGGG